MRKAIYLFLLVLFANSIAGQTLFETKKYRIGWQAPDTLHHFGKERKLRLHFQDAVYDNDFSTVPLLRSVFPVFDDQIVVEARITALETGLLSAEEAALVRLSELEEDFLPNTVVLVSRDQPLIGLTMPVLRKTGKNNEIEKLISVELSFYYTYTEVKSGGTPGFANTSVLANGRWYKFRVAAEGVHRVTYANLQAMGINPATVNPRNIRVYGNGGGVLPESNNAFRHDDLAENAILVVGEEDGVFNTQDYILFYSKGPVKWEFNALTGYYRHTPAYYDDYAYYFITTDLGAGKRIQTSNLTGTPAQTITDFLDYKVHEQDLVNLTNTGRTWYGELFDVVLQRDFNFDFPNIITSKTARLETDVAGRNFGAAQFQLYIDNQLKRTMAIDPTLATGYDYAKTNGASVDFNPQTDKVTVGLRFNRSVNSARGWLDYISVNAWRNLVFNGGQLSFGNHRTQADGLFEYILNGANSQVVVWDVSNAVEPVRLTTVSSGNAVRFISDASQLRRFVAFDPNTNFPAIVPVEAVPNQNLHAIRDIDYLIISHPDFLPEANRLAAFHREYSGLEVFVTIPKLIYNEFSSGAQDVTAIRDFARMLYTESSPGKRLQYMLLFGDASFDYKDKLVSNTNFVPTYQTEASLNLVSSIATDDYFGFLDAAEGGGTINLLDIGIGRFPVATIEEAAQMVDKVLRYVDKNEQTMGPWRNEITFVADDGDSNLHLNDAERMALIIESDYNAFNVNKIYLDAYRQIATPGGQKAPDVNEAINRRIEKGTLIMNYSGHGGEVGWTEEKILEIADILSWRNRDMMPVFVTATCEFSRYDDPTRRSAGEMVFLNPDGGAIAMFTTARATYASTNLRLNRAIYDSNLFEPLNGQFPTFGDVIRRSKVAGDANDRKFVLLGDPAVRLTFPQHRVVTTHVNGKPVGSTSDTLKALGQVSFKGIITDRNGQLMNNFNGVIYPTVYDKATVITTFGDQNPRTNFSARNSILYKGKVSVVNGQFEFSFVMPKDIAYRFGSGRISYYATNYQIDAHGAFEGFSVGGFSNNELTDNKGPEIRLFMGDTSFVSGGFTSESPRLLAFLKDETGINTTGAGIGHDLVATITGATNRSAVLNDFYIAALDKSNEGVVNFPFANLNPGKHTLTLKAWDVLNNSNTASIDFEVILSSTMHLDNVYNYPNPFSSETNFVFSHNQANEWIDVEIQIFDLSGQLMKSIREQNYSTSFTSMPIRWDGTLDSGQRLAKGLYIYRLVATTKNGARTEKRSKLIFFR